MDKYIYASNWTVILSVALMAIVLYFAWRGIEKLVSIVRSEEVTRKSSTGVAAWAIFLSLLFFAAIAWLFIH